MKIGVCVTCSECGQQKQPRGLSAPLGALYCQPECHGYQMEPLVGDLWPGETEEDFGYPCSDHGTSEVDRAGRTT